MEFKITINVDKDATRIDVKSRLEQAISESSFKWKDNFIVSNFDGYHEAYLEGLHKGEEIFNKAINRNR